MVGPLLERNFENVRIRSLFQSQGLNTEQHQTSSDNETCYLHDCVSICKRVKKRCVEEVMRMMSDKELKPEIAVLFNSDLMKDICMAGSPRSYPLAPSLTSQ